ncbi:MAG: ABC transporter permease [Candidatus Kapabacteria bacterium]|nr:ABC transporter permease [Candidatus Kapabacteria bacterium]MCS7169586.1 ABC transporter permease [Candidatus Kapabacteria bacterium]MDW7996519.1 ABC transporter permease [Bacteroidota bacterium]MDW8224472.1 ABC transporter permease [Bacteroidota bacterium]
MPWWEILRTAVESLRAYWLRSLLTLFSVAIGVFAIMAAGTAVNSLNFTVFQKLEEMGESTFFISRHPAIVLGGSAWREYLRRRPITYEQGQEFKRALASLTPFVCLYGAYPLSERIRWGGRATDPDVSIGGADEMFFYTFHFELAEGRPFTEQDLGLGRPVVLLGADVAGELFGDISPIGQQVRIRNRPFEVIGVLKPQGSILGQSRDNFVLIPTSYFVRYFVYDEWSSLVLVVRARYREELMAVIDESIGVLRRLRGLKPWQPNDFEIETNESLRKQFAGLTQYVGFFGLGTGAIALLAAGIGIMNIMLVAVRERTREIGIRKAVGAPRYGILLQFLAEAVILSLLGGALGILLGILAGWALGRVVGVDFTLPWGWMMLSIAVCIGTGLCWGTYPAWKAATLDPVEALRYE